MSEHYDDWLVNESVALRRIDCDRDRYIFICPLSVSQGYQLRLFLESFGIRSALLNAELPLNSRSHILQTFNKGLFDYLIATGEHNPVLRNLN